MQLNSLNLNSLIVFQKVFGLKSMTLAAKELGMTQPGVSQHISTLESDLSLQLFVRDRKKIIPTKGAVTLYNSSIELVNNLQSTLTDLTEDQGYLSSEVIIGAPIEFGNNILMPLIAKLNEKHPEIKFNIRYGLAGEMNSLLGQGEIDFAFVDDFQSANGVNYEQVYQEELVLCCSKDYLTQTSEFDKTFFEGLSYASYFSDQAILREWFKTAMGYKKMNISSLMITEDTQGVYAFIKQGMGVGILPRHMIKNNQNIDFYSFKPRYKTVFNGISLSYLAKRTEGPFLKYIHNYFQDNF